MPYLFFFFLIICSADSRYEISSSRYGKNGVRLLHIARSGEVETARELEVSTRLRLSNTEDYTRGDNRYIVATDSQKNIVYVLAKKYGISSPEEFCLQAAEFFLQQYPHVVEASVEAVELSWDRVSTPTGPHNHAFIHQPRAERWAKVSLSRQGRPELRAGLRKLRVLKTTKSSFTNFVRDAFRTLPDAEDRIFSTIVSAEWTYSTHIGIDFNAAWETVMSSILEQFGGPKEGVDSPSVQNTLYLACAQSLDRIPQMSWIQIDMPNCHYLNLDLSVFPKEMVGHEVNRNVFLPIDKPAGFIHASLQRKASAKL